MKYVRIPNSTFSLKHLTVVGRLPVKCDSLLHINEALLEAVLKRPCASSSCLVFQMDTKL